MLAFEELEMENKTVNIRIPCMYHAYPTEDHILIPGVILMNDYHNDGIQRVCILAPDEEEYKEHTEYCNNHNADPVKTWEGQNRIDEIDCDDIFYIKGERYIGGDLMTLFCW